jgi:hypothetical protein
MSHFQSQPVIGKSPKGKIGVIDRKLLKIYDNSNKNTKKLLNNVYVNLTNSLSEKHPFYTDKMIFFRESDHKYAYLKDGNVFYPKLSVTGYVHQHFEHFDREKISLECANRRGYYGEDAKVKAAEFKDEWDDNSEKGTALHACIENYYTDGKKEFPEVVKTVEWKQFLEFDASIKLKGWIPYRSEVPLWAEELKVCGVVDMIFYDPSSGEYHLYDWKRCKKIWNRGFNNRKGLGKYKNTNDCNYIHYCMQLQLYETMLKKTYNMDIASKCIVVFHENNSEHSWDYCNNFGSSLDTSYKVIKCVNKWIVDKSHKKALSRKEFTPVEKRVYPGDVKATQVEHTVIGKDKIKEILSSLSTCY